jgi:hypothetical protein
MPLAAAKWSLALFAFSLFWMKDPLIIRGLPAIPADLLFLVTAGLWLAAMLSGQSRVRWNAGFWPLLIYFAALAISAIWSTGLRTSAFKLATQAHLLAVPILTYHLVDTASDLRRLFIAFIAGAGIVAAMGIATLLLFPLFGADSFLSWPLHNFGTLPVGPYPRLELTFEYPAMMANYLTLAVMLVMLSARSGWIGSHAGAILIAAMLVTALFALTPGFGGLLCMMGIWLWSSRRGTILGRAGLIGAIGAGFLEVLLASVTPILHPTAPFLIEVAGFHLAPAVRLLAWIDAARNFLAHPIAGHGIGVDAVLVPYISPDGRFGIVTDAHNMVLSIAAQAGILGVVGMTAVLAFAARRMRRADEMVFGLSLAFLCCMLVQGFVGSFEDARHLWLAYGLMLAAAKVLSERQMVPDAGFEPAPFGLQNRCSTN